MVVKISEDVEDVFLDVVPDEAEYETRVYETRANMIRGNLRT